MILASKLIQILPQKFLGVIPLYIGVEIILGIAILNKVGGFYGILSIFTGHPITFWQLLYNMLATLILPFYISGLINLKNRRNNIRKISLTCLIYICDTIVGCLYTLYFIYFWFSHEDTSLSKEQLIERAIEVAATGTGPTSDLDILLSQSASKSRELFVTISGTIIITAIRFYLTLVIISFTRALLKQDSNNQRYNDIYTRDNDEEELLNDKNGPIARVRNFVYKLEVRSKEILLDFFN